MLVELTMHTTPSHPSADSPIDGIRILALLPEQWRKDLSQANGEIIIRVDTQDDTTGEQVEETITAVLDDPAISHWSLRACQTLSPSPPEPPAQDPPGSPGQEPPGQFQPPTG
ncbi:hypothetical protein [Sphaerisporangium corydalis]|uniref:Uncharacterized protein n=1 Tax=Sphaerisporangium corydalis TaxID=1441875 RepID=A0ABV9ELG0_9ACTN|nr:hypothetical protein [Sphaerisporangium corydalis]